MHGWGPLLHVGQYIENKQGPIYSSRWVISRGRVSPLGALNSLKSWTVSVCTAFTSLIFKIHNAMQIQTAFSALPQEVLVSIFFFRCVKKNMCHYSHSVMAEQHFDLKGNFINSSSSVVC